MTLRRQYGKKGGFGGWRGERIVFIDHVIGIGQQLFEAVRQVGAVGIASKRAGSPYRGGPTRDWLKAKVSETGALVITGYIDARRLRSPS